MTVTVRESFDYIIVGGGSAGCALAHRLTTTTSASVLLLEAGPRVLPPTAYDASSWPLVLGSEYDWKYRTVAQTHAANRAFDWPRGRIIGGCASMNGMVFLRGAAADYDEWERLGCRGWGYHAVLEEFRALETYPMGDTHYRGTTGPLHPQPVAERHPLSSALIEAAVACGHPRNADFNGARLEGVGWNDLLMQNGRREDLYTALIEPLLGRDNFHLWSDTVAARLMVDHAGPRVRGVHYVTNGRVGTVRAEREVIVCAGAVASPHLLLLSGIGPAAALRALDIEVVADVPGAGKNLHDHLLIGVVYEARIPIAPINVNVTEACLFAKTDPRGAYCDIEISFVHEPMFTPGFTTPANSYSIIPGIIRPQSRGTLTLASNDPADPPVLDPNYLSEEADLHCLRRGIEMARDIGMAAPLDAWRLREVAPGPEAATREALQRFMRQAVCTWYHPVGACKMGVDPEAVVDPELRVIGIEGLRVADASIMPNVVSANTNAASLMIGWRGAGLIAGAKGRGAAS
jgi:choline dehydrogenase-like flavoprotein